jgi:hypothetical protein
LAYALGRLSGRSLAPLEKTRGFGMTPSALRLMEAEDQLRAAKLGQLRHDNEVGLHSGPARPWSVSELKREGGRVPLDKNEDGVKDKNLPPVF